jgi:hypothetical protein
MSAKKKFCPECGETLGAKNVCEKCGYDGNSAVYKKTETKQASSATKTASGSSNQVWDFIGRYIPIAGKWAWIVMLIGGLITIIIGLLVYLPVAAIWGSIPSIMGPYVGALAWEIIKAIIMVAFAIIWVKPKFSNRIAAEKYDEVLDDAIKISTIRIPWMWIMGVILVIFSGWSWGWIILGPAIIITFFGPSAPYNWKA